MVEGKAEKLLTQHNLEKNQKKPHNIKKTQAHQSKKCPHNQNLTFVSIIQLF